MFNKYLLNEWFVCKEQTERQIRVEDKKPLRRLLQEYKELTMAWSRVSLEKVVKGYQT